MESGCAMPTETTGTKARSSARSQTYNLNTWFKHSCICQKINDLPAEDGAHGLEGRRHEFGGEAAVHHEVLAALEHRGRKPKHRRARLCARKIKWREKG